MPSIAGRTAAGVALVVALAGCGLLHAGGGRSASDHVLRFSEGIDVTTLNPLLATVASTTVLAELTMAHFERVAADGRLIPELVTEIPTEANGGISADGRSATYHLRRGVRWSDGVPFDADDVVFTVRAIRNPANNISIRDAWDHVTGVDEPDKYTVVLHFDQPYGEAAWRFFSSLTSSCVLPKHILGSLAVINQAPYNALPVGIGPFRFTAFRRGDAVEMEANPYYFRGPPKLHKIVYKLVTEENTLYDELQTGELDLWGTVGGTFYDRVKALPHTGITMVPSQFMGGVYLNVSRAPLDDPVVRRALRLATNRAFILANIVHGAGYAAESVVPAISQDHLALPLTPFDPKGATELLEGDGWKLGAGGVRVKDGRRLIVQIALPSGYAPSSDTAELLRAEWEGIGVAVETKVFSDAQYFAPTSEHGTLDSGNFDASLLSESGLYDADVTPRYGCAYFPPHGLNIDRFCSPDVDASLRAYTSSLDPGARRSLAARVQREIDGAAPTIVLYERGFVYAYSSRVTGFHPGGFAAYDNMMDVDVTANP